MSKDWYPVVDVTTCTECGTCVGFCPHGVYDKEKAPVPVVVHGEGCVSGCTRCAGMCPSGAISYADLRVDRGGCYCACSC